MLSIIYYFAKYFLILVNIFFLNPSAYCYVPLLKLDKIGQKFIVQSGYEGVQHFRLKKYPYDKQFRTQKNKSQFLLILSHL